MRISELINLLNVIQESHGDQQVLVRTEFAPNTIMDLPICEIASTARVQDCGMTYDLVICAEPTDHAKHDEIHYDAFEERSCF